MTDEEALEIARENDLEQEVQELLNEGYTPCVVKRLST